jgi:hypothetical protein
VQLEGQGEERPMASPANEVHAARHSEHTCQWGGSSQHHEIQDAAGHPPAAHKGAQRSSDQLKLHSTA